MLGVPPALANTKFPEASSGVIGRDPPEARASEKNKIKKTKQLVEKCTQKKGSWFSLSVPVRKGGTFKVNFETPHEGQRTQVALISPTSMHSPFL